VLVVPDVPVWVDGLRSKAANVASTSIVSVFPVLEMVREVPAHEGPAGAKWMAFRSKSCGAGGGWYDGGMSCRFTKKFEINVGFNVFDAFSAALTFIKCFLLARWASKFLGPPVLTLTSMRQIVHVCLDPTS